MNPRYELFVGNDRRDHSIHCGTFETFLDAKSHIRDAVKTVCQRHGMNAAATITISEFCGDGEYPSDWNATVSSHATIDELFAWSGR